jgi:hypothetical protein
MVVAAIAFRELKRANNQQVIDKVIVQLKKHPDYSSRFEPKLDLVDAQDQELFLFMLGARWSDDIRDNSPDDDKQAHFIDIAFVPLGLPGVATADVDQSDNVVIKFNESVKTIKTSTDEGAKAKALTWLLHLVGDVHQPLHAVTMFTHQLKPPEGDRGGNEIFIRARDGAHTMNLHAFWDDLIVSSDKFQTVRNRAAGLAGRQEMARNTFSHQLASNKIEQWVQESYKLAKSVAYHDGAIEGSGDRSDGKVLPEDYIPAAQATAERQIVLAGYRLADLLKELASSLH